MIIIIIKSLLTGFLVAAIPGAVQATVFAGGLERRARSALLFAFGASLMDATYMLLAYLGFSKILEYKLIMFVVMLTGALYVLYLGLSSLNYAIRKTKFVVYKERKWWEGIILVLLSPPTILYFLSSISTFNVLDLTFVNKGISVVAVLFGSFSCFVLVALIGVIVRLYSTGLLIKIFRLTVSFVLLFFSVSLIAKIVSG